MRKLSNYLTKEQGFISIFFLASLVVLVIVVVIFFIFRPNISKVLGVNTSTTPEYQSNVILVKLKPAPAQSVLAKVSQTNDRKLSYSNINSKATGIASVDALAKEISIQNFEPIFVKSINPNVRIQDLASKNDPKAQLYQWYQIKLKGDSKAVKKDSAEYKSLLSEVQKIQKLGEVEIAMLNPIVKAEYNPNDPLFSIKSTSNQWAPQKIQANVAWDKTKGSSNVKVAVLDTGIQANHPDLIGRVTNSADFTGSTHGAADFYGHGTHISGIVAANIDNLIGIAGVSPGVSLLNTKVLGDSGGGSIFTVTQGIIWAIDNGADVINMSLGANFECKDNKLIQDVIDYANSKNVVIVAAAGNEGIKDVHFPANCDHVISVASTDINDNKSTSSNYSPDVDIAAPGEMIVSTMKDSKYGYSSGTSMASPHVAAVAALVKSMNPTYTSEQIIDRIKATADKIAGTGTNWEAGRVNANRAVNVPTGQIFATPNPCQIPIGKFQCTSGIGWITSSNAENVKVTIRENPGSLFAAAPRGEQNATWITANGATFDLYSNDIRLASVRVVGNPPGKISASPNPCILNTRGTCTSTITWSTVGASDVEVTIRENPGSRLAFAPYGSKDVPWITANGATFDLYAGGTFLASVKVKGTN